MKQMVLATVVFYFRCVDVKRLFNVKVDEEFKVTLHEQVRYRCTLQY